MNCTPLSSSTLAWLLTWSGTAGFCSTPVRNEDESAAIRIDPASAVPTEAPRLVTAFWTPPTSALCSSGTADTVTDPSWEASAPMPSPISRRGMVTISAPASVSRAAIRITDPASSARIPRRTTRRGETSGRKRGMRIAAASSVSESGRSQAPVLSADRPRATDRYSGTTKNTPICTRYWKKNIVSPPVSCLFSSMTGSTSGSPCRFTRRASQRKKSQISSRPASMSHTTREIPSQDGASGLGWNQPHSSERSTP